MNVLRTRRPDAAPAIVLPDEDPAAAHLRDEPDPDPLVEALTARLRKQFPASLSCDEWGRPVAYRHVVRAALSALPPHVTRELAERLSEHDEPAAADQEPAELQTQEMPAAPPPTRQPVTAGLGTLLPTAYADLDETIASFGDPAGAGAQPALSEPTVHGVGWPEWSPLV